MQAQKNKNLDQWFLTFFYISYPFIRQDHQIYPNALNGTHLLKIRY